MYISLIPRTLQHPGIEVTSFPGFPTPEREYVYAMRAWYMYLFSCEHDVIENRKRTRVFSTFNYALNTWCV